MKENKNNSILDFFRNLKISYRLIAAFVAAVFVPLAVVGYFSRNYTRNSALKSGAESMLKSTNIISLNIKDVVERVTNEAEFLLGVPPVQGMIRAQANNGFDPIGNSAIREWKRRLEKIFYSLGENKKFYKSIKYVSEDGRVLAQVNHDNNSTEILSNKRLGVIKGDEYLTKILNLTKGKFYISQLINSRLEQNNENYIICGIPVYCNSRHSKQGAIIIEMNANKITENIDKRKSEDNEFYILSEDNSVIYKTGNIRNSEIISKTKDKKNGFFIDEEESRIWAFTTSYIDEKEGKFWKIINIKNEKTILGFLKEFYNYLFLLSIVLLFITVVLSVIFAKKIVNSLLKVRESLFLLGEGKHPKKIEIRAEDEIGDMIMALNNVVERMKITANFAQEIGKGNLIAEFKPISQNDILGNSLIEMRDNLIKAENEVKNRRKLEEKQNEITKSLAEFDELLRKNSSNLKKLTSNTIKDLVDYLEANQGAIFGIKADELGDDKHIGMLSCVAYESFRKEQKRIEIGEGLVGRCIEEKETILLKEIPQDYVKITSGLGGKNPSSLLLVPLKNNDEVIGAIELASFKNFNKTQIEFTEKLAESITTTIATVQTNEKTRNLLKKSQEQSEILVSQEEELRQNLEELETTQEELARREIKQQKEIEELSEENQLHITEIQKERIKVEDKVYWYEQILDSMISPVSITDLNKNWLFINKAYEKLIGQKRNEILGLNCANANFKICKTEDCEIHKLKENQINKVFFSHNERDFESESTYIKDRNNTDIGFISTLSDITEEKKLKEKNKALLQETTKNNEILKAKEEILSNSLRKLKKTQKETIAREKKIEKLLEDAQNKDGVLRKQIEKLKGKKILERKDFFIEAVLQSIPDLIFFKNKDLKYIGCNRAFEKNIEKTREEIIDKDDFDIFANEIAQKYRESDLELLEKQIATRREEELTLPNGETIWLETLKTPIYSPENKIIGIVGISRKLIKDASL